MAQQSVVTDRLDAAFAALDDLETGDDLNDEEFGLRQSVDPTGQVVYSVRVPEHLLEKSLKKAQKIADRAAASGLEGGWRVWADTETDDHGQVFDVIKYTGTPPSFGGWTFAAVVERLDGGTGAPITRSAPGYEGAPFQQEWLESFECDHCHTRRNRSHMVVVEKDGVRYRVGSSCVKDFLGWEYRAAMFDPPLEDDDFDRTPFTPAGYHPDSLFTQAAVVVQTLGWRSRGAARDYGGEATADHVVTLVSGHGKAHARLIDELRAHGYDGTDEQKEAARGLVQEARDWLAQQSPDSDYIRNLQAIAGAKQVGWRQVGLATSLVGVYQQAKEREAKEAAERKAAAESPLSNDLYGEPKKRYTLPDAELVSVRSFETDYGPMHIHTFHTATHRFEWATSSVDMEDDVGQKFTLTGTVKDLRMFRDKGYTRLTRCKAEPIVND